MRLKMIGLAGVSLLLLAGCGPKSPLAQSSADTACVQKSVCAVPAQTASTAAATPPPSYAPRPRRAARYRAGRWSYGGGGSYSRRTQTSDYDGGTRDYAQVYSTGDTRVSGVRVQVQSSDSYSQSSQSEATYSSYGGGYVAGSSYSGGSGYVVSGQGGCPGPCGSGRVRAAGRDRDGYLTWPSK